MAEELNLTQKERDILVQCVIDAYEALRIVPGVEPNGPALVWLADHIYQTHTTHEKVA